MIDLGSLPDWIAAVAATGTLVIAGVAAKAAFKQVGEARTLREDQARPFVVVDFEPSEASTLFMNVVIENVGATLAKDVKITFDPPLESTLDRAGYGVGDKKIGATFLFAEKIPSIAPGKRYVVLFDQMADRYESKLPRRYDVTVELCGPHGKPEEATHQVLDLDTYYGHEYVEVHGLHHVAKSLRGLAKKAGVRSF